MTPGYFESQMNRMMAVYGEKAYPGERLRVYWASVRDLSDDWLKRTVDYFIAYEQYPPMMAKWQEQISKQREILWQQEKRVHEKEAKEFLSHYGAEDIKTICGEIQRRLLGGMDDQNFAAFNKMLTQADPNCCKTCGGDGVYWDGKGNTLCHCYKRT